MQDDRVNPSEATHNRDRFYRFGNYEFDLHTQELSREGIRIKLAGHPARVLAILISRPGDLVTREELQKQLWTEDTFSDYNHGLNAAVNKLREALNDAAVDPKYIETLPRRGYRFIGELETVHPAAVAIPKIPSPLAATAVVRIPHRRSSGGFAIAASLLFVIAAGIYLCLPSKEAPGFPRAEHEQEFSPSAAVDAPDASQEAASARVSSKRDEGKRIAAVPAIYREASGLAPEPTVRTIISGPAGNAAPQISPDGKRIAFMSNRSGPWQIWVSNLDGSDPRQLSFTDSAGTPRWSPDGRSVAFDAPSSEGTSIYIVASDGSRPAQRLVLGRVPSFSRDGKWIYFADEADENSQVWRVPVAGGTPEQLTHHGGFAALESGDGYLYYSSSPNRNPAICRIPIGGGEESCSLAHLRPRTWSSWAVTRDGILFVEDLPDGKSTLTLYGPEKRELRDLISLQTAPVWIGASADGTKAIVNDTSERQISLLEHLR